MHYTNFLLDPVKTVQFLSLFTYLNKLSEVLYSEKLLQKEHKGQIFPIVNAFYKCLNQTEDEIKIKRQLTQKLLQGSYLYGGNENEILDMEYVNTTLDYIISSAVFSQNGNIYGYIANIVSTKKKLKLSLFKQTMYDNLFYLRHLNDDGSVSKLSQLAIQKIAETLLWPLFPEPTKDIEIISIKYMYAQAGMKLAQSAQLNLTNLSFSKYVTIGITVEATVLQKKLPTSVLNIFKLPALIFYAYKEREKFNQRTTKILFKDEKFWNEAFFTLFSHLNTTFETINQQAMEEDSLYQFHIAMSNFRNRTAIGKDFLRKECAYTNETELNAKVEDYKTYASSYYCPKYGKTLPNLDEMYKDQLPKIREKYQILEVDLLQEAFKEFPDLKNLINLPTTTVVVSQPKRYPSYCSMCTPQRPTYNQNVHFFALQNESLIFFAMEQNENNVTILLPDGNQAEFNARVGLAAGVDLGIPLRKYYLKGTNENFTDFVQAVAKEKAELFVQMISTYGYDKTSTEKFLDIVKVFIPFYSCVESASAGDEALTFLTCFMDVLGFVPFIGQLSKIGFKLTTIAANRLFISTGISIRAFTLRQAILSLLSTGLKNVAVHLQEVSVKVLLTKEMFKSLSVGLLRAVDPGFEFVWKLSRHGSIYIGRAFRSLYRNVAKRFPTLKLHTFKYRKIWQQFMNRKTLSTDLSGMTSVPAGQFEGHDVFRYIFPGGDNPFGPKFVRLSNKNAELHRVIGIVTEMPVVVSRVSKRGNVLYKKVNLKTEMTYGLEMRLNKNNVLENVQPSFLEHIYNIVKEGLGGRGAQLSERQKSIDNAAKLVASSNLGYTEKQARDRMKHYILATHDVSNAEDAFKDLEPFGSGNVMDIDIETLIHEHFAEEVPASGINPNLNNDQIPATILDSGTQINFGDDMGFSVEDFIKNYVIEDELTNTVHEELNKYLHPDTMSDVPDNLGIEPHNSGNNGNEDPIPQNQNLDNDQNFDKTMKNRLGDEVDSIIKEIGYSSAPTFNQFANDWIGSQAVDNKYFKYYVKNPTELETLLFKSSLRSGYRKYNKKKEFTKIISIFQQSNVVLNDLNNRNVYKAYVEYMASKHVNFDDFFVLYCWKHSGFIDTRDNPILTALLEKALYRLGIREIKNISNLKVSKQLFYAEVKVDKNPESNILDMKGKSIKEKKLIVAMEKLIDCHKFMKSKNLFKELGKSGSQITLFIYKLKLDSPVLIANVGNLLRTESKRFIILSHTKYVVEDVQLKEVWGYTAKYFVLRNVPFENEETMLADAMKEIEIHSQTI